MQKTIIFATDGSANANACVQVIGNRTKEQDCLIHVVAVDDQSPMSPVAHLNQKEADWLITKSVDQLKQACPSCTVTGKSMKGKPAAEILKSAAQLSANQIFIGAHSHHGALGIFMGSVAAELARQAPCSVTLMFPTANAEDTDKVLVCIDHTDISASLVQYISEWSWRAGTEFLLLNVLEPDDRLKSENPKQDALLSREAAANERKRMDKMLDAFLAELKQCGPQNSYDKLIVHEIAVEKTVLSTAESRGINHIILGTHSRKGLDKFLLGSVAEAVAKAANRSVTIVRPPASSPQ
ncbi:MAG TPA: universal stress protein [Chroococcales cyanobacterium]